MRKDTRHQIHAYESQLAKIYGVDDVSEKFSVDPTVEQALEKNVQERSTFLSSINIVGVEEQSGEKLGMGASNSIASTTDTDSQDRQTSDPTGLDKDEYFCTKTDFDTHIKYSKLDTWAKFPNFQTMMRDIVLDQIGRDRMMIGFNGIARAATSDRAANPLLQDVNTGWLQEIRNKYASQVMSEGGTAGEIRVGKLADHTKGDYANLDALIFDLVNSLIEPWHREDTGLKNIMGREIWVEKAFPIIEEHAETPTEKRALDMILAAKQIGGLFGARVPFFPSRSILITRPDNLSIYYQTGSRRRAFVDNAKRDRYEDYQSVNEDYVIEDKGMVALAENIKFPNADGTAWE